MKLIGNIIWVIFGGWIIFLEYLFGGIALCLTVVGIPFGIQAFKLAYLGLIPFGIEIESGESAAGCFSLPLNIIWLLFGGFWIFVTHVIFGIIFCITIIGIPFGIQHFKLARVAFWPFGKRVGF